jgi:hypothetical protein
MIRFKSELSTENINNYIHEQTIRSTRSRSYLCDSGATHPFMYDETLVQNFIPHDAVNSILADGKSLLTTGVRII